MLESLKSGPVRLGELEPAALNHGAQGSSSKSRGELRDLGGPRRQAGRG
jgi:hypothetical protein